MQPVVNAGQSPSNTKRLEQIDRIVNSSVLQNSEALCTLLKFLARRSLEGPEVPLKEHQIATVVFGRSPDFDPRLDSTVRVQMSRLRAKLAEYYNNAGRDDSILVEIPKGSHGVTFREREAPPVPAPAPPVVAPPAVPARHNAWKLAALGPLVVVVLLAVLLGIRPSEPGQSAVTRTDGPLYVFWRGFLQSSEEPLVVFSNAEFKGRPESGLRYFDAHSDSRENINDLYTGVGEALAIDELSRVFRTLNKEMLVRRSGLLSWAETRNRDLIFAGSPTENLSLRDLPVSEGFTFRTMQAGDPRPGDLAIVNPQPHAGEASLFFASPGLPIAEDYAVVTLRPGLHPGQSILLLAGTTTLGTQAAAEFVSQNDHLEALRKRLNLAPGNPYPPFSIVLQVRIARGVPVETSIVAVRAAGRVP